MKRRGEWQRWTLWAGITVLVTVALLALRGQLEKTHVALTYLLLVLAGSARAGYRVGLALSAVAFVLFDWFFLPPYNTLAVNNPLDWYVLAAFLIVSVVAARLLYRLQLEADTAEQRATEIDRFAVLGAETLNLARADQALAAIAATIGTTVGLPTSRIHIRNGAATRPPDVDPLVEWAAEHGRIVVRQADHTTHVGDTATLDCAPGEAVRAIFLPLAVRGRTVGVLELAGDGPMLADPAQRRLVAALGYYAALAVERVHLEAEAEHAETLREADRLKNALLASVSHDLRTPLTTIKALAHDLGPTDDRALVIEEEADRLNRLVADLLDLSRLQAGAMPLQVTLNAADDLAGGVVQRVSGVLGARRLAVEFTDTSTLLVGRFDLVQSLRILVNLVENANKYAPAGTPILLTVQRQGDWLRFVVADRGPGVPVAERDRIFEPFYRPSGAIADSASAGLGLSIARRLAELQGGTLAYAPRAGGGSEFILALPAAELPASAVEPS